MKSEYIEEARKIATRAASETAAQQVARLEDEKARTEFLREFVAVVQPALEGVVSSVPRRANGWLREFDRSGPHVTYFSENVAAEARFARAILVIGEKRPIVDPNTQFARLEGEALYLGADGYFFSVSYSGEYNRKSDTFWWEARPCSLSIESVIQERWPLGDLVREIVEELEACTKGAQKARMRHEQIAKKVRAIAVLLEGLR